MKEETIIKVIITVCVALIAFLIGMDCGVETANKIQREKVHSVGESIRSDYYMYQKMYDDNVKNPMTYINLFEKRFNDENE